MKKTKFFSLIAITSGILLSIFASTLNSGETFVVNENERNKNIEVSDFNEFKSALLNDSVQQITLDKDIDLSQETHIENVQDKYIFGNGYKIMNTEHKSGTTINSNSYFIGTATDVFFTGVVFDNVEFFIDTYNFTDQKDAIPNEMGAFDNITIKNMDLNDVTMEKDVKGLFINNATINWNKSGKDLVFFKSVSIKDNVVKGNTVANGDLGFVGGMKVNNTVAPPDHQSLAINSFSLIDNNISDNGLTSFSLINDFNNNYYNKIFFNMYHILVAQNFFDTNFSLLTTTNNSNKFSDSRIDDFWFFENSSSNDYIISSRVNIVIPKTPRINNVFVTNSTKDIENLNLFKGTKIDYTGNKVIKNNSHEFSSLLNNLNQSIGTLKFDFKWNELNLEKIIVAKDSSFIANSITLTRTKTKLGMMTIAFGMIITDDIFVYKETPILSNASFKVGSKEIKTNDGKDITYNSSLGYYKSTFDFKGLKLDHLYNKDVYFSATLSPKANANASVNGGQNLSIKLDNSEIKRIINDEDITSIESVPFINAALGITSIVLAVIIFIIILLLILWFLKVKRDKKETERLYGTDNYSYVQNKPVEIPEGQVSGPSFDDNGYYDNRNYENNPRIEDKKIYDSYENELDGFYEDNISYDPNYESDEIYDINQYDDNQ